MLTRVPLVMQRAMDSRIEEYFESDPPSHYKGKEVTAIHSWTGHHGWLVDRVVMVEAGSAKGYVVFHYEPGQFFAFDSEREANEYCDERDLQDMEEGKVFPPPRAQYLVQFKARKETHARRLAEWEKGRAADAARFRGRPLPWIVGDFSRPAPAINRPRVDNLG